MADNEEKPKPIEPTMDQLIAFIKNIYSEDAGPLRAKPPKKKAIGGPIENPMEKKQKPLYEEELGMYGGGAVRKKLYARGGSPRPTRG